MTLPSRSEVEQKLASFEGCLPEILNAKYALAGRQLAEWVRELMDEVERLGDRAEMLDIKLTAALMELRDAWAERDRLSAQLSAQADEVELYIAALDTAKETEAAQSERITALEKENEEHIELMDGFRKLYSRAWQEIPKSLQDELAKDALHLIAHRRANTARLDASGGSSPSEG